MISIAVQDVTCDNGMPAVFAYPADDGSFPTVILMHERYGLVRHTRDQAMRCARDGYAVLAPNFFFRHRDPAALNAGGYDPKRAEWRFESESSQDYDFTKNVRME